MVSSLVVDNLRAGVSGDGGEYREVLHGISFRIESGQKLALVGESGSGKSVAARAVVQLDPDIVLSGSVRIDGQELIGARPRTLRSIRGSRVGFVFQDPLSALNPSMRIGWQIMQPLMIRGVSKSESRSRAIAMLERLGLRNAARRFDDYPHQFSGGMRQRVVMAIALVAEPDFLIADEPTTALDVRVQADVLDLLDEIVDERGTGVLLITHDLGIVAGFADDVAVLREGNIVEHAVVDEIYAHPAHPYTRALLRAVPRIDADVSLGLASVGHPMTGEYRQTGVGQSDAGQTGVEL
ncbi:MAG: ABC transporter ATP-binding protein [Gordonia sp. (in: high G+C Gram-positive bacteria)]